MFFDSKKNVSYRGNSKKEDRSAHLERLERERRERDQARLRLKSASTLQAVWRSHRARKLVKNIARMEWDAKMARVPPSHLSRPTHRSTRQAESPEALWALRVFNFFYQPVVDAQRLERLAAYLLGPSGAALRLEGTAAALHLSRLLLRLQSALPTAKRPEPLLLLDLLTSDTWLSAHAQLPRTKIDALFTRMLNHNLFASLRGVLLASTIYESEHRGKVADVAARMVTLPSAFGHFVQQLLTLPHFPLAVPRPTLTNLLAALASVPSESLRFAVPRGGDRELVLLDNVLLLCAPVINSAPNALGCFLSLLYTVVADLLPPPPLTPVRVVAEEDDDAPPPQPVTLPLALRERLAGMISGGVLRSIFFAASSAVLSRSAPSPTVSPVTATASATVAKSSLHALLPPMFFSATRLIAALRAWEPFEPALTGVSKIALASAQLAPMWALVQRSVEFTELCALDHSLAPETLAVFQLFFTSLHIALLDEDDEDFFAGRPLATADAKAVAMSLRAVVGKSITAPTLTPAWETTLDAVFAVLRELHDRSFRRPFLDAAALQLQGQELALATMNLEGRDPQTAKVLSRAYFLFPFETRIAHFQRLLHEDREVHQDDPRGIEVTIRRKYILEDSLRHLRNINLRKVLRIVFVSLDGATEVGHGGGVTKEYLHLFATTAFSPQFGLFLANEQHRLYPNPNSSVMSPDHLEMFTLMGRLLGKMLYDGVPTYIPLTEIAYSLLTGRTPHFDDLVHLDQAFYRSLLHLKRQQTGIEDLLLNFTININSLDAVTTKELKPHGHDIPVTAANKNEYIALVAFYKIALQFEQQFAAFKRGFHQLIPEAWASMFSPAELALLANGSSDHSKPLDLNDLRRHTNYTNGYYDDHPTIQFFWQVVAAFTPDQQHKLLQFVTGTDSVPLLGFSQLEPRFCVQLSHTDPHSEEANDDLPTASTCMNLLKLNPFLDPVLMREKLLYAIENCVGFELS